MTYKSDHKMTINIFSISVSDLGSLLIDLPYVQGLSWWTNFSFIYSVRNFLPFYIPGFISCHASLAFYTPVGIHLQFKENFMIFHVCVFAHAAAAGVYEELSSWGSSCWPPRAGRAKFPSSVFPACTVSCTYCYIYHKEVFCFSVCHPCFIVNAIKRGSMTYFYP